MKFRKALHLPLIYVGGLVSRDKIEEVLNDGFEFVAMARALVNEPGFVNRMKEDEHARCDCGHSNYCIARMYSEDMVCHKNVKVFRNVSYVKSKGLNINNGKEMGFSHGASSGIGLAYAEELASRGYQLVIVSNEEQAIREKGEFLSEKYGIEVLPLYRDLAIPGGQGAI